MQGFARRAWSLVASAAWWALAGSAGAEPPAARSPQASVAPGEPSRRLRLDVERHIDAVLVAREKRGLPRFETSVEVVGKSPQAMLDRFFHGLEMECGPVPGGAPTAAETRAFRPQPALSVDFLALARVLLTKLAKPGPERYFLYGLRRENGALRLLLRDGRLPASALYSSPGTSYELIEGFADLAGATAAWQRLERGLKAPAPGGSDTAPPPFATTNCRPRHN